jgi:hypothetical protein
MAYSKRADDKRRTFKGKASKVSVNLPDTDGGGPFKTAPPPLDGIFNDRRTGSGKGIDIGKAGRAK